jgi:hypothetical protein
MQSSVGAFEAKTHFGQPHDLKAARAAAFRLRSLAKEMNLGSFDWEEWKQYRDEGRASS